MSPRCFHNAGNHVKPHWAQIRFICGVEHAPATRIIRCAGKMSSTATLPSAAEKQHRKATGELARGLQGTTGKFLRIYMEIFIFTNLHGNFCIKKLTACDLAASWRRHDKQAKWRCFPLSLRKCRLNNISEGKCPIHTMETPSMVVRTTQHRYDGLPSWTICRSHTGWSHW